MNNLNRKKNAVTEVMGTILLLLIAVALFSVVYLFVFSIDQPTHAPSASIISTINGNNATLEHWGGEPLKLEDLSVIFLIDGEDQGSIVANNYFELKNENPDGNSDKWEVGEILDLDIASHFSVSILGKQIDIRIVDIISNSILMMGPIQSSSLLSLLTSVNNLPLFISASNPTYTVTASGDSSLDNVSLYYQRSTLNDITNDPVDVISSEDPISDIGTHSDFDNQKAVGGGYDTLTEGDTGVSSSEDNDTFDSYTSNYGIVSDPANAQDESPPFLDSLDMTLQEEDTGTSGINEWLDVNAFDQVYDDWQEVGSQPYLDTQDQPTNYVYTSTNNDEKGWFNFENTAYTGSFSVNISIYCNNDDGAGNDGATVYVDYSGSGSGTNVGIVGQHTNWQYDTIDLGSRTQAEVNNLRVYFKYYKSGGGDDVRIDHARIGISQSGTTNYQIDQEYQFTSVDYDETNEEICIYISSHTGTEDLTVEYDTGSGWANIGTISSGDTNTWKNFTATGLDTNTYTIRLTGASEASDTSQDTWEIDCIFLHLWTISSSNYGLDLEVQWTNLVSNRDVEMLCIKTENLASENLQVDIWNDGSWDNLISSLTSNSWNNVSVQTWLTDSTLTIRYKDTDDTNDLSSDTWQIDAALIYSCNKTVTTPWTYFGIDISSPWDWNFNFPAGTGYYEFYSIGKLNGNVETAPSVADESCYYT